MRLRATFLLLLWLAAPAFAQGVGGSRVTDFPQASLPLSGAEMVNVIQGGISKQTSVGNIQASIFATPNIWNGLQTFNGQVIFNGSVSFPGGITGITTFSNNVIIGTTSQTSLTINNLVNTPPNTRTGSYALQAGTTVTASVTLGSSADFYTGAALGATASVPEGGVDTTLSANANNAVAAGSFVIGQQYGIWALGNTDFTLVGAAGPAPGTVGELFTATGAGAGTGSASDAQLAVVSSTGILVGDGLRILTGDRFYDFKPIVMGPCGSGTSAGSFAIGTNYYINTLGTFDFTSIGAASNDIGLFFKANGTGTSGTGTACAVGVQVTSNTVTVQRQVFTIGGLPSGTAVYDNKGVITAWNTDVELTGTARNWYGSISGAVGVINQSSSTYIVCGVCVEAEHNHIFQGIAIDTAFGISDQSGAEPGFKSILSVNDLEGRMPVDTTSTIFISQGFASVKSFIDFSSMGCSTFEVNFFGFNVDCAGSSTSFDLKHTGNEFDQSYLVNTNTIGGSFSIGRSYTIVFVGNTDFTLIGASSNTVGVTFTATGAGTGSGIATSAMQSGDTVTIFNGYETEIMIPSGTLTSLTLKLPACNGPNSGYISRFETSQAVSSLSMGTYLGIGTINKTFPSLAANDSHAYFCYGGVQKLLY